MARPRYAPADLTVLAALANLLRRSRWPTFLVTPATLLRWHRELYARGGPIQPTLNAVARWMVVHLVERLARESPGWGYLRIVGECRKLGVRVSASPI